MQTKPILALIGPSGIGKTSFSNRLILHHGFSQAQVGYTRPPRLDDGSHCRFLTSESFLAQEKSGAFLEVDTYNDQRYGTYHSSVEHLIGQSSVRGIVLDLTPRGYLQAQQVYPALVPIKLTPDNMAWLHERLRIRGMQTDELRHRDALLESFLAEMNLLKVHSITVGFKPETWDDAFSQILKILRLSE